jgi:hypothetical protein
MEITDAVEEVQETEKKNPLNAAVAIAVVIIAAFRDEYDRLNSHDDQFDLSDAVLSLALLGSTALTQKRWLFWTAAAIAAFGLFFGLAGLLGLGFHPNAITRLLS